MTYYKPTHVLSCTLRCLASIGIGICSIAPAPSTANPKATETICEAGRTWEVLRGPFPARQLTVGERIALGNQLLFGFKNLKNIRLVNAHAYPGKPGFVLGDTMIESEMVLIRPSTVVTKAAASRAAAAAREAAKAAASRWTTKGASANKAGNIARRTAKLAKDAARAAEVAARTADAAQATLDPPPVDGVGTVVTLAALATDIARLAVNAAAAPRTAEKAGTPKTDIIYQAVHTATQASARANAAARAAQLLAPSYEAVVARPTGTCSMSTRTAPTDLFLAKVSADGGKGGTQFILESE